MLRNACRLHGDRSTVSVHNTILPRTRLALLGVMKECGSVVGVVFVLEYTNYRGSDLARAWPCRQWSHLQTCNLQRIGKHADQGPGCQEGWGAYNDDHRKELTLDSLCPSPGPQPGILPARSGCPYLSEHCRNWSHYTANRW
jgi:hypothetical protein